MSPTPEQLAQWRKESHKNWLEDKELNATSSSSKAYVNGYLRARTEQATEIVSCKPITADDITDEMVAAYHTTTSSSKEAVLRIVNAYLGTT
jgi:dissimilatory sulfite reductase (desulfoviridin) alpha/beta subunit